MKYKKVVIVWFITIAICINVIGVVNYLVDPFYLMSQQKIYKGYFNERIQKINYLDNNHENYNSYMFGSSRIGTTQPSVIERYIINSKFYNFWLSSANLDDYRIHLNYIIKKNYKINNLYLQIGLNNINESDYASNAHPYITSNISKEQYYLNTIYGLHFEQLKNKISKAILKKNNQDISNPELNINTGVFRYINRDTMIKNDHKFYIENEEDFKLKHKRTKKFSLKSIKKLKNNLEEIINICNKNNIKLIPFITPHHRTMMDEFEINDYLEFLEIISKHTNFYDFSGYNSITTNDYNYYEGSHYLPKIGELIAARIFNDKSVNIPNDFGVYITQDNIYKHLDNLKRSIEEYDLNK